MRYQKALSQPSVAVLAAVGVMASIAWAAHKDRPEPAFTWKDGVEVYAKVCVFCHDTTIDPVPWFFSPHPLLL